MKGFFIKENLQQLKEELGIEDMSYDQRVDEFLLQIGHDFMHQALVMTIQLKKTLPVGSSVEDVTLIKHSMGKLTRKSLWNQSSRKASRGAQKDQKVQNSSQMKTGPKNGIRRGNLNIIMF